ncbi:hypothetical protein [Streptomyces sp. IBSBF 2435]|uniref:hypothetical protein n=1 Tax=Streptomyces sp. IBSBF 2435 TaxID=2903531 RepID=UPI002FDC1409
MPDHQQGDGGRKKRQWWASAKPWFGASGRFVVAMARFFRDLIDIAGFIDRHL